MNRLLTFILSFTLLSAIAQKNVPVSTLPAVDSVGPNDYFPLVQGGTYHRAYIRQLPHYVISPPAPPIGVVARPANQVVFGTGAGISSDSGLTYTPAGLFMARYKAFGAALGVGNLSGLGAADSSAVMFAAKTAIVTGNNIMLNANDSTSINAGNTLVVGARNISINGGQFSNNTINGNGYMDENVLYNGARMSGNLVEGHSEITRSFLFDGEATINGNILNANTAIGGLVPGFAWIELFNDCHVDSNIMTASGTFESIHAIATSSVSNNQLIGSKQYMTIGDIIQSQEDAINHNILEGASSAIANIRQWGSSSISYDTLLGDNSSIENVTQVNSSINYCRIDSPNYSLNLIDMKNATVNNAVNIDISNVNLQGVNLYLNGFNRNINNESIIYGHGYFAQTLDFGNNPLDSGQTLYLNIIPPGYSITKISFSTTNSLTIGSKLIMGLETDDSSLISIESDSLNEFNVVWSGMSKSATGNRSFNFQANTPLISGTINIYVELTKLYANKNSLLYLH
jgi:hypothetical protein